jgi:cell wall-associated NlpC family hydrolase
MVTQLLMGEHFTILEEKEDWLRIRIAHDNYECWISNKQFAAIREKTFEELQAGAKTRINELFSLVVDKSSRQAIPVVMGSVLPFYSADTFRLEENRSYEYEGSVAFDTKPDVKNILQTAELFLNAPYMWGGRSCWGIDCSGLTQVVFSVNGLQLPRDAYQQAEIGNPLSFVEEAEPGDLAFFDNEEGKITHVGIIIEGNQILHASGKVRVDRFDHYGIFHTERKKYSHMLRVIKRVIG